MGQFGNSERHSNLGGQARPIPASIIPSNGVALTRISLPLHDVMFVTEEGSHTSETRCIYPPQPISHY